MDKILGNFLTQPNRDFPLDCETLAYLQSNQALIATLGNIAGDKTIIAGCELNASKTQRGEGYIFLKTLDFPQGEILYFAGGYGNTIYLKEEAISISAQGKSYPQAYTKRTLAAGVGIENFLWDDFSKLSTNKKLAAENAAQNVKIATLAPLPFGIVQIFAGQVNKIPEGYALCDGSSLNVAEYPDLYAVLGTLHGGTGQTFKLPDLRSRFVVGYNPNESDYNAPAKTGGEKMHIIDETEMPKHKHSVDDYYHIENSQKVSNYISGTEGLGQNYAGCGNTDYDNNTLFYKTHESKESGGGMAYENRPPYYTLAYIMRIK